MVAALSKTVSATEKGKGKADGPSSESYSDSSDTGSSSSDDSESDWESSSLSDSEEEITQEYLDTLLQKARESAGAVVTSQNQASGENEEILTLDDIEQPPLPKLDPGQLYAPHIQLGESRGSRGPTQTLLRDSEMGAVERTGVLQPTISPPVPPPELTKSGKPLTKREKKELKKRTAGPDWFDMPAPAEADLPRLHREVEALRLRNQLDPKQFYRKDESEGKGIKGLPKYFAIGRILTTETPFGSSSTDNLPRSQRKRTLVDELIDDAEAKRYAKKKFNELQSIRSAKGRNTLRAKQALRKPKW